METVTPASPATIVATLYANAGYTRWDDWISILDKIKTHLGKDESAPGHLVSISTRVLDADDVDLQENNPTDDSPIRVVEAAISIPHQASHLHESAVSDNNHNDLRNSITEICKQESISVVLQPRALYESHKTPGLIVFDMDSTLIQQETIDELARMTGKYDAVSAITEAAMRGDASHLVTFADSLRARVAYLKGVKADVWTRILDGQTLTFTPGARELVAFLKRRGWKTAVISGGFVPAVEWVQKELGLDHAFANTLDVEHGVFTGTVSGQIVDGAMKRTHLQDLAKLYDFQVNEVVAVGDGSNDLPMMHAAGLGIAFNAKPMVQAKAPAVVNSHSLTDIAYLLGYTKEEMKS